MSVDDDVTVDDLSPEEFVKLQREMEGRRLRELRYTCNECGYNVSHQAYSDWNQCPMCGFTGFTEVTENVSA